MIELDPAGGVLVRATDEQVFWTGRIEATSSVGSPRWLVDSRALATYLASVPGGNRTTVKFARSPERHALVVSAGKSKARFALMPPDGFPQWGWDFGNPSGTTPQVDDVTTAAQAVAAVAWAAAPDSGAGNVQLSGVRVAQGVAVATDRYVLAACRYDGPPVGPLTVSPRGVKALARHQVPDLRCAHGALVATDGTASQSRSPVLAGDYPNVERVMRRDQPDVARLDGGTLKALAARADAVVPSNPGQGCTVHLGAGELVLSLESHNGTSWMEAIPASNTEHARVAFHFQAVYLRRVLARCAGAEVLLHYDHTAPATPWRFELDTGPEIWTMPLRSGT